MIRSIFFWILNRVCRLDVRGFVHGRKMFIHVDTNSWWHKCCAVVLLKMSPMNTAIPKDWKSRPADRAYKFCAFEVLKW